MLEVLPILLVGLWFGLPLLLWLARLLANRRIHGFLLYLGTVLVGYFVFVGSAWTADFVLEQKMNRFDLDGDGGISGDELTPAAEQAMDEWASDTGRTFAVFTGLPVTAIWAAICLSPLCLGEWAVRRLVFGQKSKGTPDACNPPPDHGNPYTPPVND